TRPRSFRVRPARFAVPHSGTGSANARASSDSEVLAAERVALAAMRLAGIRRLKRLAAQKVLSAGHRLQMGRVHAGAVAAQVVELEPVRDRPEQEPAGGAVGATAARPSE